MSSTHTPALDDTVQIVIIGGGITGLAAAYHLQQQARAAGMALRCTVVERDARLGGKIVTEYPGGTGAFVVEGGPDSFVARKPWAMELVRELGLGGDVIGANHARHATYVLRHGRLTPLPAGLGMIAPTQWLPFLRSPLFSPWGKLRMALEQVIPARRSDEDETLAHFVRRRFGQEALDLLGEPLLAAIHSGVAEQQSMLATFPNFRAMEREHGSVTRAARRQAAKARQNGTQSAAFVSLRGGIGALVDALVARLEGELLAGRAAVALDPDDHAGGYRVHLDDGRSLRADALIVTTPAYAAADLVEPLHAELAHTLREIPYVSTGTITLAYRRSEVGTPLDGFGVVIPRGEGRRINACTMSSLKFPHRAPDDYLLVRVFVGGTNRPDLLHLDDDALCEVVREELRDLLGITAAPAWSRVYRWWNANPQYNLGHMERVERIAALCPPGLFLSGSAYRGVGIPDCVRQAREAAEQAFMYVQQRVASSREMVQ
jgi:oxygen-dependent protoporphyrinogen oxidase